MRLSVFLAESSPQLLVDLRKIYQTYFTDEQLTTESLQALIESKLYVTMFNERHLGAVQVSVVKTQAQLSLLTVRDLTRRRGIAKNLLREVEKQLKIEGVNSVTMELNEIQEKEKEGLTLFMRSCGYQLDKGVFSKKI
jgi:ribosomal protein S18 acetylase RimI-like enzyme